MCKRYDPNRSEVKFNMLEKYDCFCMVCENTYLRKELQLHHLEKFEHTHHTVENESGIVCDTCHKFIHFVEHHNPILYIELNDKIRQYKATH